MCSHRWGRATNRVLSLPKTRHVARPSFSWELTHHKEVRRQGVNHHRRKFSDRQSDGNQVWRRTRHGSRRGARHEQGLQIVAEIEKEQATARWTV